MGKLLSHYKVKGLNRRIYISIMEDSNGEIAVSIKTKRLVNRVKREITRSKVLYSIETLWGISGALNHFKNENPIWGAKINKLIPDNTQWVSEFYVNQSEL